MLRLLSLFLFVCVAANSFCQSDTLPSGTYTNLDSALSQPGKVTKLSFSCSDANVEKFVKKISSFRFLESLELKDSISDKNRLLLEEALPLLRNLKELHLNNNGLTAPLNVRNFLQLSSVAVTSNRDMDYKKFFKDCSSLPDLTAVTLESNGLRRLPGGISEIKKLTRLSLVDNSILDYEKTISQLTGLSQLKELSLPINYITDLPKNIVKLKSLEVLNVSDNVLTGLPDKISSLRKLNSLSIEGNIIVNQVAELEKFRGLDIRYLSIDRPLDNKELEDIKKMFPQAEINHPDNDTGNDAAERDSVSGFIPASAILDKKSSGTRSGDITVKKEFKVLSNAYAQYSALFGNLVYSFDTLNFEERYADTSYIATHKIFRSPGFRVINLNEFYLTRNRKHKGAKEEIWFHFPMNDPYVTRTFPELMIFAGMYWVYTGDLSRKKFIRTFITENKFWFGNSRKKWRDVRLYYNDVEKNFTIELKNKYGFHSFTAYPRTSVKVPLETVKQSYLKKYEKYTKALLKRADKFRKSYNASKLSYDKIFKAREDDAWFQLRTHMSEKEKLMSKEEWLGYYDRIIADEKLALDHARGDGENVKRSLEMSRYRLVVPVRMETVNGVPVLNSSLYSFFADFTDEEGKKIAVSQIIAADHNNRTYSVYNGSMGISPAALLLDPYHVSALFLITRNGDVGVVQGSELRKAGLRNNKTYSFRASMYDKNLYTVGQIRRNAGVE